MLTLSNLIDGKLVPPISGNFLDGINPSLGEVYCQIPESGADDLAQAMEAGQKAFPIWSTLAAGERSKLMMRLADLIDRDLEILAQAESLDNGKPVQLAREVDIPRAAANFRFFAAAIINFGSESHLIEGEALNYTRRAPMGVVACISPWNLPLYLLTWKLAPALATGNCVIAKPSEITPYTAYLLAQLVIEAGFPPGVLNILHGTGAGIGEQLVSHPEIKAISFTGGTATGRKIGMIAASQFKKVSLELGGKNPVLIFEDCDFDKAVETTVRSAFTNQGEICLCGSRIFIHHSIYERFKSAFIEQVKALKVGMPKSQVDLGAIVSEAHLQKVDSYVQWALDAGALLLTGGHVLAIGDGYYYEPTVFEGLDEYCKLNQEEVFGPVVTIMPFQDETDAVTKANCTPYGLAAVIWTNKLDQAHRVAHQVASGIVWVNCWMLRDLRTPFGGMKDSGVGREGGNEALRFFTEPQNITIKL